MAKYFKAPFNINGDHYYVQVKVPKVDTSIGNNIICCVDVSGSMSGKPIQSVCEVLKDIYKQTQIEYPLFTYNTTADTKKTIKSVEKDGLVANGGTSFSAIFTAIQTYLVANQKSTTFIFMTDGQDTQSQVALQQSIQRLKLSISALPKTMTVTFHVIGFGDVNNNFLEGVRKFGNREGLFRYSSQSGELQSNFNDMFEYAMSSREFSITINGQTFASSSNEDTVGFLISGMNIDHTVTKEVIFKSSEDQQTLPLEPIETIRPLAVARALNLVLPDNEESVQLIRSFAYSIVSLPGTDLMEKLELEQIKKEIDDRMMEFKNLFTQIKMGQVPEQVKLKLSALRHDATFANIQRKKKLDLRINKNVDYFRKTDISGILDGYKKSIDQQGWNDIKQQKSDWVCTYSHDDIYELMRKSPDNVMCLGVLVQRSEEAITSPTKGLKLIQVSNTIISYDSFITAMGLAKTSQPQTDQPDASNYGQFNDINDSYCVIGQLHEKINAVIPLYINYEHMKRIRILEGIWLGYLYTLDSYGYDKEQEIGLLKLLYDIIMLRTGTTRNIEIIHELEKVCQFIVNESIGFKSAYGEKTYENYINGIQGRQSGTYDLSIPLMIAYLKKDLRSILIPVYYEHLRHTLHKNPPKNKTEIINQLVYGDESQITKTVASNQTNIHLDIHRDDPDYVEKTFIDYFHDETNQPIELISETKTGEERKMILREADRDFIEKFLNSIDPQSNLAVPKTIRDFLKYAQLEENYIEKTLDFDDLRNELLLILHYEKLVPENIKKSNILNIVDEALQGNQEQLSSYNLTEENIRSVTYKMLTAKTLEGFGGLLRKYSPSRSGPIFSQLVQKLVRPPESNQTNPVLAKEKLISLLTNNVGNSLLYKNEMRNRVWMATAVIRKEVLINIVGETELKEIEKNNRGKISVGHIYRASDKPNRHGHCNSYPNWDLCSTFYSY